MNMPSGLADLAAQVCVFADAPSYALKKGKDTEDSKSRHADAR